MEYVTIDKIKQQEAYSILNNENSINISIHESIPYSTFQELFDRMGFDKLKAFYEGILTSGNISISNIDGKYLYTHKSKNLLIIYFDNEVIFINKIDKEFVYVNEGNSYSSKNMFDRNIWMKEVLKFLKKLETIKNNHKVKILYNVFDIFDNIRIYNESNFNTITKNEEILLVSYTFRDPASLYHKLSIVNLETYDIVGYIEFSLSENNFSYMGNISYEIYEKFRNKGYAKKALSLVKNLVKTYTCSVDKTLYISTVLDNIYSQKVACSCGAKLFYEGDVPRCDKLFFLGKVNKVKIYKIDIE